MTENELKYKLEEKLQEIAFILCRSLDKFDCNGVLVGNAGLALFMYYYSRYTNNTKYTEMGKDALYDAVDIINNQNFTYTYCSGISGLAWTCDHLVKYGYLDYKEIDFLEHLIPFLLSKMEFDFNMGNYDFLHGGLGVGYYFINSKSEFSNSANKMLFSYIKNISVKCSCGYKWESMLDIYTKQKGYNISLSHGISSIVICLAKLFERYPQVDELKTFLTGAINYILSQQNQVSCVSCFPTFSLETPNSQSQYSRLGWCYGDLGIAQALLLSAKILHNPQYQNFAIKVLLHNCNRKGLKENNVFDAGLCHGTSGIAHIYNRVYKNTGNMEFKELAKYWITKTIEISDQNGLAGFKRFDIPTGKWENCYNLLEGIAGIGLSIISYLNPVYMDWDECLLLN